MKYKTTLLLLAVGMFSGLQAGETMTASSKGVEAAVNKEDTRSIYDKIWGLATLYKDDNNSVLQEFALQGRMQLQYGLGDSDQGSYGTEDRPEEVLWGDVEVRRWRLGFKSKWFRQFKFEGQIDVSPNFDPEFYGKIYDLNVTWAPSDAFNIGVGKYKANMFSVEQATSSKEILTFERTLLSNSLFTGELTGMRINGKVNNIIYTIGVYAGDDRREFSEFNAGAVIQAGVGYDLTSATGFDKAIVKFDFQNSTEGGQAGNFGANFESGYSFNSTWEKGRFGLYTDVLGGVGRDAQSDVFGFHVIPSYYIAPSLQLVGRYQFANSSGQDGLRLQSRYERLASELTDGGRGDQYQAVYVGLNYYLYGHKLKLMAGAEYHTMAGGGDGGDFDGITGLIGLRMFF